MAWRLDARIPVTIVEDQVGLAAALAEGPPAAVLAAAPAPPVPAGAVAAGEFDTTPHRAGCGCCGGRPPAAAALDRLFQARVRGQCGWFERVIALAPTAEARTALTAAFEQDVVTTARFRPPGA